MNVVTAARIAEKERKPMKIYTIDIDGNITAFANAKETGGRGERFASAKELGKLAGRWPAARPVEIWNSLPGVEPVKRFQSRSVAVTRIWAAIQNLEPAVAPDAREVAPAKGRTKKKPAAAREANVAREGSKKAIVLSLLQRQEGAALSEIRAVTGWQAHTVRGFLSAAVGKKMGLQVHLTRREDGERVYSIEA